MKKINKATYTKDIDKIKNDIYYTIRWSSYFKLDKYEILKKVPEMAGIFVLFYLNHHKKLQPFYLGNSWMGSLRHDIKYVIDNQEQLDKKMSVLIEDEECYYKYLFVQSHQDLKDIYSYYKYFYKDLEFTNDNIIEESGRYDHVFVKEWEKLL